MIMAFLQDNWDTLKMDILRMFTESTARGSLSSFNVAFMGLTPKKSGEDIKIIDQSAISLVGCLYKLVSKVLATRLRGVISSTILGN